MTDHDPVADLDTRFSSPEAVATAWTQARDILEHAEIFWLSTVRPDGRPHVTPLISVWMDEAAWFTTGPTERKAQNLEGNPHVALTTGCNSLDGGLDVVVEGKTVRVTDESALRLVAEAIASKYPDPFDYTVRDGALRGQGGESLVFRVRPEKAFGFGRGATFSQTRWQFPEA
jgi:nitroimidazol reductase NimA-like FMN-containing flavoprotein (pyridoxamine 5'-phosphate oxidase superfamily)